MKEEAPIGAATGITESTKAEGAKAEGGKAPEATETPGSVISDEERAELEETEEVEEAPAANPIVTVV